MAFVYEVRDVDGTSFTGVSKLVGFYLDPDVAQEAADAVKANDSWHSGYVTKHWLITRRHPSPDALDSTHGA